MKIKQNFASKPIIAWIAIFLLCLFEIIIFTHPPLYKSSFLSWVYFLSGIGIAVIPLLSLPKITVKFNEGNNFILDKIFYLLGFVGFIAVLYHFFYVIDSYTLNYRGADMLPSIEILANRALSGQRVYTPLSEINRPDVLYGPGFWLPYTIPILLKIDIRWTSFTFLMIGVALLWWQNSSKNIHVLLKCLGYVLIGLILRFYFFEIHDLKFSQEPLVIGYYLFLGITLLHQDKKHQWIWVGIAISLCLLSRFSLLLWIPFYLFYVWRYEGLKKALKIFVVVMGIVLALFILPFGIEGIQKFANLPAFQSKQMAGRFATAPRHELLGMAKFFSYKDGWFIYDLQRAFSLITMLVGIVLTILRPKWIDKEWLPLAFLKLTLVFFCNFLQIAYPYLFGPSTFLSLVIAIGFAQKKIEWQTANDSVTPTFSRYYLRVLFVALPLIVFVFGIYTYDFFNRRIYLYQKEAIAVFRQDFNSLENEPHWIKTVPIDSTVAHTGKYSNKVGGKSLCSCTFVMPVKDFI
ncbi:MAG: hypothetical protein RML94_16280, partial [Bacteroidia bacterium]|nr:hypothetical protein [Bacteroidia bacterium]